eukprot:3377625-Rhodomonas_salina.1
MPISSGSVLVDNVCVPGMPCWSVPLRAVVAGFKADHWHEGVHQGQDRAADWPGPSSVFSPCTSVSVSVCVRRMRRRRGRGLPARTCPTPRVHVCLSVSEDDEDEVRRRMMRRRERGLRSVPVR